MLVNNTLIIGKVLRQLNKLPSTNTYCKTLVAKGKPIDGTVIIADAQADGRGQFGNVWLSEANKNLTFSVIVYPKFLKPTQQFFLSKVVSIACCEALQHFLPKQAIRIKWPNDIYVKDKKIAGILIENQIVGNTLQNAILGIGLNVNQTEWATLDDKEIANGLNPNVKLINATSIHLEKRHPVNKATVLKYLLEYLDKWYLVLRSSRFKAIDEAYFSQFYKHNEWVRFKFNNKQATPKEGLAKVLGCTENGQLVLDVNGHKQLFNFKEVEWLK